MTAMVFGTLTALLVSAALLVCNVSAGGDCFKITAAFTYEHKIYIVDGSEYIIVSELFKTHDKSKFEEYSKGSMKERFGIDKVIDAALFWGIMDGSIDNRRLGFFSGKQVYFYSSDKGSVEEPEDASIFGEFVANGIDAATNQRRNAMIFFKGCRFYLDEEMRPDDIATLGLPCDIDAAFYREGIMYVIKGGGYWVWGNYGKVADGPFPLKNLLSLTSTKLCQEGHDVELIAKEKIEAENKPLTYEEKIEAERKYESENNCVILDAAVTWGTTVYFFNENDYVTVDDALYQKGSSAPISEWGIYKGRIDAGVVWDGNGYTYLFQGPDYFRYSYGYAQGPWSNADWSPFVEKGIDAAGNAKGVTYFFKDCQATTYEGDPVTLEDIGLPCNLDAAFSRDDGLYAIKDNQVWVWGGELGTKALGPLRLSHVNYIASWRVCDPMN